MSEERFPIVKTISFSALQNFQYCGKYYEYVNVNKMRTKAIPANAFGTLVHRHIQDTLNKEHLIPEALKKFDKTWTRFCRFWKLEESDLKLKQVAEKAIYYANGFLKRYFGNFKVLHVEYKIKQKIGEYPQDFKGYIDLVIQLENGKIIIADIKTTKSAFFFNKYKDNFKEYQLSFYKKFYSELENIPRDNIETVFIVIEKDLNSTKPLSLVEVSSGDKKLANAESWLLNSLKSINGQRFIKDYSKCMKFGEKYPCMFYNKCRNREE